MFFNSTMIEVCFFYYNDIPNLKDKVIANPQRLIQIIAHLLPLKGFEDESVAAHMWANFRDYGILEKSIYEKILKNEMSKDDVEPQAIIDLLDEMLIVAQAHDLPKGNFRDSKKYFVPCMLQLCPTDLNERSRAVPNCIAPVPLYLKFTTKYLPPGFLIRFAALLSKQSQCRLHKKPEIYQDQIIFKYGKIKQDIDQIMITEEKTSIRIDVDLIYGRQKKYPFLLITCHEIVQLLLSCLKKVLHLMLPNAEMMLSFACENCKKCQKFGKIELPSDPCNPCEFEPILYCDYCKEPCNLDPEQRMWLHIKDVRNIFNMAMNNDAHFSPTCRVHQIPYQMTL